MPPREGAWGGGGPARGWASALGGVPPIYLLLTLNLPFTCLVCMKCGGVPVLRYPLAMFGCPAADKQEVVHG